MYERSITKRDFLIRFRTKLSHNKQHLTVFPVFLYTIAWTSTGIISGKYRFLIGTTPTREERFTYTNDIFNEKLIQICLKLDINPIPRISNYKSNILFIPVGSKYEAEFAVLNNQSLASSSLETYDESL